ncbi:MAG TPA: hypothetical protein VM534_08670 [Thermoanaerobaculia bacterium]|nr:hypothetical protein [Thermoanaerobaculia bacterium]
MNPHLAPPQREIRSAIFTTAGWVSGTFVIPKMRMLVDYLNQPNDFYKLREVQLPGLTIGVPFFALQRRSVILIVPHEQDEALRMTTLGGEKVERSVSCAFPAGLVSGTLFVREGIRVSDFLMQRNDFFYLQEATVHLRVSGQPDLRRDAALVVVNGNQIIGVSEPRIV